MASKTVDGRLAAAVGDQGSVLKEVFECQAEEVVECQAAEGDANTIKPKVEIITVSRTKSAVLRSAEKLGVAKEDETIEDRDWKWLLSRENLLKLSAFTTPGEPSYHHVDTWFWNMRWYSMMLPLGLCLALTYIISIVLCAVGIGIAYAYHHALNAHSGAVQYILIFAIIGGMFTGWNIAQYASYAIQTTGHKTFRQQAHAIVNLAPTLLPCNLLGWGMCCLVAFTPMVEWHLIFKVVIIGAPPIVSGIFVKTFKKLSYLSAFGTVHASRGEITKRTDSLGPRLISERDNLGKRAECPFKKVTVWLMVQNAAGPGTCFIWTVVYVLALRLGYSASTHLEEPGRTVNKVILFLTSVGAVFIGGALLERWIVASTGYYGYGSQMLMAFFVIYNLVSDVQVRLGLVHMDGKVRLICSAVQPLCFTVLRLLSARRWGQEKSRRVAGSLGHLQHEPRLVLSCMASIITQNVSAVVLAAMACIFQGTEGVAMGTCDDGFWMTILHDALATWVLDVTTISLYVVKGVPVLYFFSLLDPFLVLATIVVVYLNVILAILQSYISI